MPPSLRHPPPRPARPIDSEDLSEEEGLEPQFDLSLTFFVCLPYY